MVIKKINACITILATLMLFMHSIYQALTYVAHYHNSVITAILGHSLEMVVWIHALIGLYFVCIKHDSKIIKYKKLNLRTYIQRLSMIILLVLLVPHMLTFSILKHAGSGPILLIVIIITVLFYGAIFTHIALSLSKALITLGIIIEDKQRKVVDIFMAVICGILFVAMSIIIPMTFLFIFGG